MPRPDLAAMSGSWKSLLISPNKTVASELSALVHQQFPRLKVFEMQSYPAREALGEFKGDSGPNICFLDLATDPERGLAVVGELLAVRPEIRIVVLIGTKNPDLILRAMRQGAAEFLVRPFDPAQLEHAIERIGTLEGNAAAAAPKGRVICVIPAKGACGATTVAATLAQQAKRAGFKRILLADLDPLTGTVTFLLKAKGTYSFVDALSRAQTLDADIWKGLVAQQGGVDVLMSPENVNDAVHDLHDPTPLIDFARSAYEIVVVDLGGPYGRWNIAAAGRADDILLVTTNELPALQAAQRAVHYLEGNQVERSKVKLLVNRYSKEFGLSREVIESGLHCDIFHLLPSDYETINRALIDGRPIGPGTNFGKSVVQLAERLCGKPQGEASSGAPKKASALSSLFSLFGGKPAAK